jgi:hypothetical protein
MDIVGYISMLVACKNLDTDPGRVAMDILLRFLDYKYASAYRIFSDFRGDMAYKNVHKRVQRLNQLGLLHETNLETGSHGAKNYTLTEVGMYKLFLLGIDQDYFLRNFAQIMENHGDSEIFKTFLYPYFEEKTFTGIKGKWRKLPSVLGHEDWEVDPNSYIILVIGDYLRKSCTNIHSLLNSILRGGTEQDLKTGSHPAEKNLMEDLPVELILRFISGFGEYQQYIDSSVLEKLAADTKFMKMADDLYNGFKESYAIALKTREGTQ